MQNRTLVRIKVSKIPYIPESWNSSPASRTKKRISERISVFFLYYAGGNWKSGTSAHTGATNMPGTYWLARGKVHRLQDASKECGLWSIYISMSCSESQGLFCFLREIFIYSQLFSSIFVALVDTRAGVTGFVERFEEWINIQPTGYVKTGIWLFLLWVLTYMYCSNRVERTKG